MKEFYFKVEGQDTAKNVHTYIHTYIHTLFIPEADDNYYIQIKLKRKYF